MYFYDVRLSKDKKHAKAKADKYFQEFIRKRDEGNSCITCNQMRKLEAGHFMGRGNEATRYEEKNCNGQCNPCNRFYGGRQFEHGLAIDKIYGNGTSHELYLKSKMRCSRNKMDYEMIAEMYKNKIDELQNR
jgi:hypothetical protein